MMTCAATMLGLALGPLGLTPAPPADTRPGPDRPNIILMIVDDLGQQDTSVPMLPDRTALNDRYRTPNLERLAARGVRFSDASAAAPVCTPSRAAIMSGQSPARSRVTYWTLEQDTDTSSRHPRLAPPAWQVNGLQPSDDLLPELLRKSGYRTIHVGKAHWGARGTPGADPLRMGFDVNVAGHAAGAPGSYLARDHFKDAVRNRRGSLQPEEAPASVWDVPGLARWHGTDAWLDDVLAKEASSAMSDAVREKVPFFLSFCPYGVHTPIMQDDRFADDAAGLDARERAYATMIAAVDHALGTLVERCASLGVLESTVIVFTSDNGGLSAHSRGAAPDGATQHSHNAPLRSGKGSAYEGGLRVPLVVAGPRIEARTRPIDVPVVGTDLYPTLLSLAGCSMPADRTIDGIDLTPVLRGGSTMPMRTTLVHQPHAWGPSGPGIEPFSSIRRGDWKLIWFHDAAGASAQGVVVPRLELYHLSKDLGEAHECSAQHPECLAMMRVELEAALRTTGAQFSLHRATGQAITLGASPASDPR